MTPNGQRSLLGRASGLPFLLGSFAKGIEHYGSTAVMGIRAKPIIDILVGVAPFEDWEACKASLEGLGYDWPATITTSSARQLG
jgi:GrpB-like predicted nucleotidyltransferase (UPF0157 family)